VFTEEFTYDRLLNTIDIPVIKEHFGCTGWSVEDIYILGRTDKLRDMLSDIAFGSVLHTVQDSFAAGHVEREPAPLNEMCAGVAAAKPGRIVEFHSYANQDARKHDLEDERDAMASSAADRWPEAVEASRQLFRFRKRWADWDKVVRPYMECIFDVSNPDAVSSSGQEG
jgi:hypothetical protein